MSITLQQLYEKSNYLYDMCLIAGGKGMKNIIQWVHTIEDIEVSTFIHGGELVFTTGIAQEGTDWLIPFIKELKLRGASGLVINVGPYITNIPKQIQEYCNGTDFPLFEIPWKTRLVDITRDFCRQIIQNEKDAENIGVTFKNLILYPYEKNKFIPMLERQNFKREDSYCIVGIKIEMSSTNESEINNIKFTIEQKLSKMDSKIACFSSEQDLFFVLVNYKSNELNIIFNEVQNKFVNDLRVKNLFISVGANNTSINDLSKEYQKTISTLKFAIKNKISPLYYDELGIKKILLCVQEHDVIVDYFENTLGKLNAYDKTHGTDFMTVLRNYIEHDCSIQSVAQLTFSHRNTINYKLNKIKGILGTEMSTLEERFSIMLAFHIMDIL